MSKRKEIEAKIQANKDLIAQLKKSNNDLYYESLLLSDDEQQYFEEEREVVVSKRPKVTKKVLFGMVRWNEDFRDEDTGEVITIERHQVVKEDGNWVV
jgi:hypothetical protein